MALGVFPDISLAGVRKLHQQAREAIASGQDPSAKKKDKKCGKYLEQGNSFEAVGREWFEKKMVDKKAKIIPAINMVNAH
jgi:hypothetical protein